MDEDFLSMFREAPRAELANTLWERLQRQASSDLTRGRSRLRSPIAVLVSVSLLVMLGVLLSFRSVRAAAQQFLDLFRGQRFVAIAIDPTRLEQLKQLKGGTMDVEALLSRSTQVLKKPGEPQVVDNPVAAGEIAGIHVSVPTALPEGMSLAQIRVQGEAAASFTTDTARLRQLLELLDIRDIQVPEQLNGTTVTVHVPPAVVMRYTKGNARVTLMQSLSPEITLPLGVDLSQVVEIGLRIAGLAPGEAQRFAYSIDWHSTLLVPVPANAASFREVDVQGAPGLLIETDGKNRPAAQNRPDIPPGSLLLWSGGDMVYALAGGIRTLELVQMANSLQ
jgi:hypothetical protein